MENAMKLLHSYARFSHASQAKGDSQRRQAKIAQDFAEKHGFTLSNLTLLDAGKSGFKGNRQKALNHFLKLVEDGTVKPGDTLLVEAIDRLSRKGIRATQDVVNFLLNAGIDIAIVSPIEKIYRANDKNDFAGSVELAAFSYASYTYSKVLSDRLKSFHEEARSNAKEKGKVINSGPVPAWLSRTQSKDEQGKKDFHFEIIPEKAEAVKFIFSQTLEGVGQKKVCKLLNEKFTPIARSDFWNETYIRQILTDRKVLGEYQPHITDEQGKRLPIGQPIANYFPQIISEDEYLQAQAALANRRIERGPSKQYINLFTGLLHHAVDKCSVHIYSFQQKRADGSKQIFRRLKSEKADSNVKGASTETVDIIQFEQVVLKNLREIDLSVFSKNKSKAAELTAVNELLKKKIEHLTKLQAKADESDENLDALLPNIIKAKQAIKELTAKADELKLQNANAAVEAIETIKFLQDLENTPDNRQKLREAIKRVVTKIALLPVKLGEHKSSTIGCLIEIELTNGKRRSILLCQGKSLTYTDEQPDSPSLWELDAKILTKKKEALKKWLLLVTKNKNK